MVHRIPRQGRRLTVNGYAVDLKQGTYTLALSGEFDASDAATLRRHLDDLRTFPGRFVIDLERVTFFDTAVLGELAFSVGLRRERGLPLRVARTPRSVLRVAELVGLRDLLDDDGPVPHQSP